MYTGNTWAPKTLQTRKRWDTRLNYRFSGPPISFHPTSFFKDHLSQLYCTFWLHIVPLIHKFKLHQSEEFGGKLWKWKSLVEVKFWVAAAERNVFTNNYFLVAEGSCLFLGSHLSVYLQLLIALNQFALDSMSASPEDSESSLPYLHSSPAEETFGLCDHGQLGKGPHHPSRKWMGIVVYISWITFPPLLCFVLWNNFWNAIWGTRFVSCLKTRWLRCSLNRDTFSIFWPVVWNDRGMFCWHLSCRGPVFWLVGGSMLVQRPCINIDKL